MDNFYVISLLLLSFAMVFGSNTPSSNPKPQLTPKATCRISSELQAAIKTAPSTPQDILMEFPSRVDKVLAKPDVITASNSIQRASAIVKHLKSYSVWDHKIHLERLNEYISRKILTPTSVISFWIINAISVRAASPSVIESFLLVESWKPCIIKIAVPVSTQNQPTSQANIVADSKKPSGSSRTQSATSKSPFTKPPGPGWGVAKIGAPAFSFKSQSHGRGVNVAVIDSGVNVSHESLVGKWDKRWQDYVGGKPLPEDSTGHGTAVASIVVGTGLGIAPKATFCACRGIGQSRFGTTANILKCAQWVAGLAPTPNIVVNSWGTSSGGITYFNDVIRIWESLEIHHVFPIGNSGPGCGTGVSPGDQPVAFSVGSVDRNDKADPKSSRGPNVHPRQLNLKPDLSAPGTNILVAGISNNEYSEESGTSLAAAHVAGSMALILSAAMDNVEQTLPSPQKLRDLLINYSRRTCEAYLTVEDRSCFYTGSMYPNAAMGFGILDLSEMPVEEFSQIPVTWPPHL